MTYDEWFQQQLELVDEAWTTWPEDRSYDWKGLHIHKTELQELRRRGDSRGLASQLRAQSYRNVYRILSPALYRKSPIHTKQLIHDYVWEVRRSIEHVTQKNNPSNALSILSSQDKRQLLFAMRKSLGRTTLVLQGGAMVTMAHLGVVKALFEQDLLPKIITGTSTGALVAGIVGTSTDEMLLSNLQNVRLDAFERARKRHGGTGMLANSPWVDNFVRRVCRWRQTGHLFDIDVLEECVQDNLGDITFEEAYAQTGRILNITIALPEIAGTPQLLNYITAPHVLIRSAIVASIATSKQMYAPVHLFCKDDIGLVDRYFSVESLQCSRQKSSMHYEAPLSRIGELFNVNHFIVSQTRPYIIPFILIQRLADHYALLGTVVRLLFSESLYWLQWLASLELLGMFFRRILVDEEVPSVDAWSKVVLTPSLYFSDLFAIFDTPTETTLDEWRQRGEHSVWPAVCELQMRCDIEYDLDAAYDNLSRTSGLGFVSGVP